MSALTSWFNFCNYAGDAAFCSGGTLTAEKERKPPIIGLLSGLLTTFGGGALLRDILTLGTVPKILGSIGEIVAVAVFAALLILAFTYDKPFRAIRDKPTLAAVLKKALVAADSLGVLAFVAIGYQRGMEINGSVVIAIMCGFYTACGGGILALVLRGLAEKGKLKRKYIKTNGQISSVRRMSLKI
ncbi:hypothetical protein FACS1894105_14340 [Clostridia bacterium]|nr:hypothetical protein FACS1894105_14340 [Clostridia bacterium]